MPVVNGQWVKGVGGAAVWSLIVVGDVAGAEATANKGQANGYAPLDAAAQLWTPNAGATRVGFIDPAGASSPMTFVGLGYNAAANRAELGALSGGVAWRDVLIGRTAWLLSNGIKFGTSDANFDTNLYRSAANVLTTDGALVVAGNLRTNAALVLGAAQDVSLYRSAAGVIRTDQRLDANALTVNGVPVGLPAPVVNGQWIKGVGGAAVWAGITPADVPGVEVTASKNANGGYVGRSAAGLATAPFFQAGGTSPVSSAVIMASGNGNDVEFGHGNPAGYRSVLGHDQGGGAPFLGLNCEAGTNNSTWRTRGIPGVGLTSSNSGQITVFTVPNANADNQATAFAPINASAFNVSSDRSAKQDVENLSDEREGWSETLMNARPYRFRRHPDDDLHIGLMADELPDDVTVRGGDTNGKPTVMVDLYELCTALLGTVQLLAERVEKLEAV
jgi:hypothetical protein